MKRLLLSLLLAAGAGLVWAAGQEKLEAHITWTPDEIRWKEGPAAVPPGAKMAVLEGDPKEKGLFTMRLLLPAGYKVPPHWHPAQERVTVLSGVFLLGQGDKFDETAMKELPAGSLTVMPPKMRHFAMAKVETVIQLNVMGPWGITYVDPADDPRKAAPAKP